LSKYGLSKQILDESIATYKAMADRTGTLWESLKPKASCNHGFASHLTNVLYRDVLGVYEVLPCERKVRLRFIDSGLAWCKGSIPVGDEQIEVAWTREREEFQVELKLPKGYTYEIVQTNYKVVLK
jgi:alpha-L-rhamnosidase